MLAMIAYQHRHEDPIACVQVESEITGVKRATIESLKFGEECCACPDDPDFFQGPDQLQKPRGLQNLSAQKSPSIFKTATLSFYEPVSSQCKLPIISRNRSKKAVPPSAPGKCSPARTSPE